jgi:hypothetical protein
MSEKEGNRCGPHAQIALNDAIKITQCTCGAYHVSLLKRGVSVQIGVAEVRALAEGMGIAVRVADAEARGLALAQGTPSN